MRMAGRKQGWLTKVGLGASVIAALGASICCIGPIAAAFLGLTSMGALLKYERFRPLFTGVTLLFLAGAFYMTYRNRPAEAGEPASAWATLPPQRNRTSRGTLWAC